MTSSNTDLLLDPETYRQGRIRNCKARYGWPWVEARTPPERDARQTDFRREFARILGGLDDWERVPLEPAVTETRQMDGYRREQVSFDTRPGLRACGYFLIPDGCPPGRPAVLCLPGHGRGVDTLIGLAPDGTQRLLGQPDEYAADFALGCVARGYPAFALEHLSFGRRRDAEARAQGQDACSCHRDSVAALMLGETLAGWRAWDALRALDYLETRTDCVDPTRLAVLGISGGGLVALFAAALDARIQACVVSAYFNTFRASVLSVTHCVDNYVPGLLGLAEMPDLAALIAPRALFVESGREDPIFPLAGFEQAVAQARSLYAAFDSPTRFGAAAIEGGHRFDGQAAYAFLEAQLPATG